jgi:parallel beta-helix repeat protein
MKLSATLFLAAVTTLAFAASAGAVDGTIEINQAKVMAAGGFPYKIGTMGSYRLTGNLTVSSTTADAIDVNSNHVTIDLNGFSISGPGSSSANGIDGPSAGALTVENGTITGFAGNFGVVTGNNSIVRNMQVNANGYGIQTGNQSVISGNTVNNAALGGGIICNGSGCVISGNTADGNSVSGIYCSGTGCQISGNTTDSNGNSGMQCIGCVVSGNTVNSNGFGISCPGSGCLITGNTIDNNGSNAIFANDSTTGYGGNVLNDNAMGISGGTSLGAKNTNLCSGTAC